MLYKLSAVIILTLALSACNQSCNGMMKNLQKNVFNKKCSIKGANGGIISNPNADGSGSTFPNSNIGSGSGRLYVTGDSYLKFLLMMERAIF